MSTIRAFIAVEIDHPNKEKLSALISHLKKSNADVKWVNENHMHLTLKFLGNIEQAKVQEISEALNSIAKGFKVFATQFSKIGAFPNMRRPRVIWMGIDKGSYALKLLNEKIESGLEQIGFAPLTSLASVPSAKTSSTSARGGAGKEKREYRSHLTLGRVRSLKNISELARLIDETQLDFQDEIKIDRLILFQSTLTPKGAIYTRLSEYPFSV